MHTDEENALRVKIGEILADGLETQLEPFPETHKEFAELLAELRHLPPDDWEQKLIIGGFTDYPYGEDTDISQSCETCRYYLKHRKYCELPSLDCPVEPEWSCIVWRI